MSFFSVGLLGLLAGMSFFLSDYLDYSRACHFSVGLSGLITGLSFPCRIIRISNGLPADMLLLLTYLDSLQARDVRDVEPTYGFLPKTSNFQAGSPCLSHGTRPDLGGITSPVQEAGQDQEAGPRGG